MTLCRTESFLRPSSTAAPAPVLFLLLVLLLRTLLLQVPLHIFTAVTKASQQAPKSCGVLAPVSLLNNFFAATNGAYLSPSLSTTTALQSSILQQFEQSGLPQEMPALLTAAAEELTAQAADKSYLRYAQMYATGCVEEQQMYAVMIRSHAQQLLLAHGNTSWLWPGGVATVRGVVGSAAASMQLHLAVVRNVSSEVREHLQRGNSSSSSSTAAMQVRGVFLSGGGGAAGTPCPAVYRLLCLSLCHVVKWFWHCSNPLVVMLHKALFSIPTPHGNFVTRNIAVAAWI